jgi:hypothetical protein
MQIPIWGNIPKDSVTFFILNMSIWFKWVYSTTTRWRRIDQRTILTCITPC